MENFDTEKAARVWQRVQAPQPEAEGLPALIAGEGGDGHIPFLKHCGSSKGCAVFY